MGIKIHCYGVARPYIPKENVEKLLNWRGVDEYEVDENGNKKIITTYQFLKRKWKSKKTKTILYQTYHIGNYHSYPDGEILSEYKFLEFRQDVYGGLFITHIDDGCGGEFLMDLILCGIVIDNRKNLYREFENKEYFKNGK